jgi:hypothetical protein
MHASLNLHLNCLEVSGNISNPLDIFPNWSEAERLGVVVHEPYGAIGASLLFQAFMAAFYENYPQAATKEAQYPPVFMFHVGGKYGDFSALDFWPARKQVFTPHDPYEVLGALRDRGITRLVVPNSASHDLDYIREAPSGWTDLHATQKQTISIYEYSPSGRVAHPDFTLRPLNEEFGKMVDETLDLEELIPSFKNASDEELEARELGPTTGADYRGWVRYVEERAHEVSREDRLKLIESRIAHSLQSFRNLTVEEGLGRLVKPRTTQLASSQVT